MNLENVKDGDFLVMPLFGVGKCKGWQTIKKNNRDYNMLTIFFYIPKVTMHFPIEKIQGLSARKLAEADEIENILKILGLKKIDNRREAWNKKMKAYYEKINTCDLTELAEVIRDAAQNSTRQYKIKGNCDVYTKAVSLLAQEMMVVYDINYEAALKKIQFNLDTQFVSF